MVRAYVSIGSNIDPGRNIRSCLAQLGERFNPLAVSRTYRSAPVGFKGADFYNLVVGFDTALPLTELNQELRWIERYHGRSRRERARWSSRTLDLDLLLYGDTVCSGEGLELPRPDIIHYAFVLQPLAEIAGDRRHPVTGQTFASLWQSFAIADQPPLQPVRLSN